MKRKTGFVTAGIIGISSLLALTLFANKGLFLLKTNADFNYLITFDANSGNTVSLVKGGGSLVATVNSGSAAANQFTALAEDGYITFDFDDASKTAGVAKFASLEEVRVVSSGAVKVLGSNYQNAWGVVGEYFVGEDNGNGVFTFPYSMNYVSVVNDSGATNNITSISLRYECSAAVNPDEVSALSAPTGLMFTENTGVLAWNAVTDALAYVVSVDSKNFTVTSPSIDLTDKVEAGAYTVEVFAKHNAVMSTAATKDIEVLYKDVDLKLEAEYGCLDRDRNWSNDSHASNGSYGLDFNDCGQGMYFRYYAFEAGARDVTIAYSTGMPTALMSIFVNGTCFADASFTENTGWFGGSHKTADAVVNDVPLAQGWNEIYLIKNNSSGSYVQVDYIIIAGTNNMYKLSEYNMESTIYNLEAEAAHWHYDNANQRPINWGGSFSMGYGLGEINAENDGAKFDFDIAESGTYAIRPVMGGNKSLRVSVDNATAVTKDFGAYSEWNNPVMAANDVMQVALSAGHHTIDIIRNGAWFTFDKLVLEKVA